MIYKNSYLDIIDNSGPKKAKCLNIKRKKIGYLADLLVVTIKKKFKGRKKIKKNILYSIFIISKKKNKRKDGTFIVFKKNRIVLVDDKFSFFSSNLKSLICKEIKKKRKNNLKLISYAPTNI
jgi:ribosomal protein L14